MPQPSLSDLELRPELMSDLRRQNPWWQGEPSPVLPPYRRWPFGRVRQRLDNPVAPIVVIRGPRQVGKTTLQQQLVQSLLDDAVAPERILRVQFDDLPSLRGAEEPILRIVDWYERAVLRRTLNAAAHAGQPAFIFLDEVQNLATWDVQLKSLVDHATVRVVVTGSSALRIGLGRDSLAGRIQTIEVGPLRLWEIAALRGFGTIAPLQTENEWGDWLRADFWHSLVRTAADVAPALDQTFAAFSERGAYPLAQTTRDIGWPEIADQLNETVIRRVIEHDLRVGARGRKRDRQLLEEVFRMACRYAGQAPNPATLAKEAHETLGANVGSQRIRQYLDFLNDSLLMRAVEPLEIRLKKRRGHRKLCLCDHALRAAWLQEIVPLDPTALDAEPQLTDLAGHLAESVLGYYLVSLSGLDVAHLPERAGDPEVDFVLTIGERRLPVEVKYRRKIDPVRDTLGLRVFLEKARNNAPLGLLVTRDPDVEVRDPRIVAVPLKAMLLVR